MLPPSPPPGDSPTRSRDSIEHATFERLITLRQAKCRDIERYSVELLANMPLLSGTETVADAMKNLAEAFDALEPEPGDAMSLGNFYRYEFEPSIRPLSLGTDIDALIPRNPHAGGDKS